MAVSLSFKNINKLAIPALISGISEPILSLTDVAIVGHVKEHPTESLAAVGIVTTFLSMLIWVLGQTRSALSSIISQYLGAGKIEEIKTFPAQTAYLVAFIGILIVFITYPLADFIFKFYNASDLLLTFCVDYYRIRVFGFPFTLFTIAVFGTFRGLQNTYYPMIIALVGAVVNVVFDFILVFGVEEYIPAFHVKGAAWASVLAQIVMAILSAVMLIRKTKISLIFKFPLHPELKRFTGMVLNLFIRTLALNVTLYMGTRYATGYGESYIAAYTIAINIWFLGAFIVDGYASAGNILAGKLYGANEYNSLLKLSLILTRYALVVGFVLAILVFFFYYFTGTIFSKDTMVLNQFYDVFWLVLLMQPFCAVAFVFDGIFKGLGKMKILRNVLLFATFIVFIPFFFLFDYFDLKLKAIFLAMFLWIIARAIPLIITFRKEFFPLSIK